jgi:hypothetical protein
MWTRGGGTLPVDTYTVLGPVFVAFFGMLAALSKIIDIAQSGKSPQFTDLFMRWSQSIRNSGILNIHITTIELFLQHKTDLFGRVALIAFDEFMDKHIKFYGGMLLLFIIYNLYIEYDADWLKNGYFILHIIFAAFTVVFVSANQKKAGPVSRNPLRLGVTGFCVAAVYVLVETALYAPLFFSTLFIILFFPIFIIASYIGLALIFDFQSAIRFEITSNSRIIELSVGAGFSVALTLCGLTLGHLLYPHSPVPQTLQMITANAVFDGLTVVTTIIVLQWAVAPGGFRTTLRIPAAIVLDIGLAALWACCSLLLGLILTPDALSISEVVSILIGLDPGGKNREFGPYFWVMHTAFIPTATYLSFIMVSYFLKLFSGITYYLASKVSQNGRPFNIISAIFTFLSSFTILCTAVYIFIIYMHKAVSVE